MDDVFQLIKFVKNNANYFKECEVFIDVCGKKYKFNIISITDEHIKLQLKFKYSSIFYSDKSSLENLIKNIIDEDGRHIIPNYYALAQRAVTKRNLRGLSLPVIVEGFKDSFDIANVSREYIYIEKIIDFDDIKNDDEGINFIVKNELSSFKPHVDEKLNLDEQERLKKEEKRREKQKELEKINRVYSKEDLISRALYKKYKLKTNYFPIDVNGKVYNFRIEGVGDYSIKLGIHFPFDSIFNAEPNTIENKLKTKICSVLGYSPLNVHDFSRDVNDNSSKFDFDVMSISIGEESSDFKLIVNSFNVKLLKFVSYDDIMKKFNNNQSSLETILKKHIENFKPKPWNWGYHYDFVVPKNNKKEYKHPTVSNKENPEIVRNKIKEKQRNRKEHEKSKSYKSTNRSSDISRILR